MKKTLAAATIAGLALAPFASAGGQQVIAQVASDGQSMSVRTYRCGTPASLSLRGTAEGLVGAERRQLDLKVTGSGEPGAFRVERQWPAEGRWVLVFTVAGPSGSLVSSLVVLEPGAELKIAEQRMSYDKPTSQAIEAALAKGAAVASAR